MKNGVFVLSLDTELAWGSFSSNKVQERQIVLEKCRDMIKALLDLLDANKISATWDVVGHLFLDHCAPIDTTVHPEITRPNYKWFNGDWFKYDPCADIEREPLWYGRDIIDAIRSCKTPQEIACHTFSHVLVGEPGCSQNCFDSELKLCKKLAGDIGIELKSFVYPRNKEGHYRILSANGFITFRGREPYWYAKLPNLMRKAGYIIDGWLFFVPPPVKQPYKVEGCWNITGSFFYRQFDGLNKLVPMTLRILKVKCGIDRAVKRKQVFHLWFHPFNLSSEPRRLLEGLEEIFRYLNSHIKNGDMKNLTMRELAEELDARTCPE